MSSIPVAELRRLKKLLDEGVLTKDEFAERKDQLLNQSMNNSDDNAAYTHIDKMSDQHMWRMRYKVPKTSKEDHSEDITDKNRALDTRRQTIKQNKETTQIERGVVLSQKQKSDYTVNTQNKLPAKNNSNIPVETLLALKKLHDDGVITDEEYAKKKKRILGI